MRNIQFKEYVARRIIQTGVLVFQIFCLMLLMPQAGMLAAIVGVIGIAYTLSDARRMGWSSFGVVDAVFVIFYGVVVIPALVEYVGHMS